MKEIRIKVRNFANQFMNFFYWGWKLRNDQDYDYGYLEEMLLMKLKSMHGYFKNFGHLAWNQDENSEERADWKALELTIKLLEKVIAHNNGKDILKHDLAKWGEWVHHDEEGGSILSKFRPSKALSEEDKKQWKEEWWEQMDKEGRICLKYRKLVYRLMEKYGRAWWD